MTIDVKCCVNCVCIAVCKQKDENALIHNCSIIKDVIKSMNFRMGHQISVFVDGLNRELLVDKGAEFLFISHLPIDVYSTLIAIERGAVI